MIHKIKIQEEVRNYMDDNKPAIKGPYMYGKR